MRRKAHGDNHPLVAEALTCIGLIHYLQKDFAKSLASRKLAFKIRRKCFGEHHRDVAWSMHSIACVYFAMGQYEDAKHWNERSIECYDQLGDRFDADYDKVKSALDNCNLLLAYKKNVPE